MARNKKTAFDFDFQSLKGKPMPLKEFAGRPVIIVNTASKCGFTPQYKGLESIWQRHKAEGLVILGVPSNDFAGQEPGDAMEIAEFCELNFGVDFPLTEKVHVKGADAHPLFNWLGQQGGFLAKPRWNFYKYFIGRDGQLKTWFSSVTTPDSAKFQSAVKKLIAG
ncbi:MAG: glutathione peroxidase [Parvibaculum sp.]|nr:glutathione peroxidase [Parvibaculum sp.]